MRTRSLRFLYEEYESLDELSAVEGNLVQQARDAATRAYAPFSGFRVGAAVLLENGEVITGNNQENPAYTNGLCAERVALFYAGSRYPGIPVVSIAVTAENSHGQTLEPVKPCGSCRQVLAETEFRGKREIRIILDGKKSIEVFHGTNSLLPFAFGSESLD